VHRVVGCVGLGAIGGEGELDRATLHGSGREAGDAERGEVHRVGNGPHEVTGGVERGDGVVVDHVLRVDDAGARGDDRLGRQRPGLLGGDDRPHLLQAQARRQRQGRGRGGGGGRRRRAGGQPRGGG